MRNSVETVKQRLSELEVRAQVSQSVHADFLTPRNSAMQRTHPLPMTRRRATVASASNIALEIATPSIVAQTFLNPAAPSMGWNAWSRAPSLLLMRYDALSCLSVIVLTFVCSSGEQDR